MRVNADEDARRPAWLLDQLINAARSPSTASFRETRERLLVETAKFVATVSPEHSEQFARSNGRDSLLATMAARLAVTDPARSERLLGGIGPLWDRWTLVAMAELAVAVAPSDPRRAKKLLNEAASRAHQASSAASQALADMATVVAPSDPRRATRLIESAARVGEENRQVGVHYAAMAATALDLRLAERIATSAGPRRHGRLLAEVARAAAATDPDRAVRIARSFKEPAELAPLLADIAAKMASRTGSRADSLISEADQLARRIMDQHDHTVAMTSVIKALATRDPDRAVERAKAIAKEIGSPWPTGVVAGAIGAVQPERAERIAKSIENDLERTAALAAAAEAMAAVDPERAERLCESLPDTYFALQEALAHTAIAMVPADIDRAEELALSVTHPHHRAEALLEVLKVVTA
ncbi:hypothetical protein DL991_38435 [Amycolatopsis sp. WAC 01375]|nr:hypothetical protein DL991_38435 [Amycolatopsis sp. WAC 01375]